MKDPRPPSSPPLPVDDDAAAAFLRAHAGDKTLGPIDFADPLVAASVIVAYHYMRDVERSLHYWHGEFWRFLGAHYQPHSLADLREIVYPLGHNAQKPVHKKHVDDVVDALRAVTNLADLYEPPCWLLFDNGDPKPSEVIPLANGLLDVATRRLLPCTPRFFAMHSVPYQFDPEAPTPDRFLAFLRDLWGDDQESIGLLQEWFGYCLLPVTELQKMLLLLGPIRSGKGTIIRLLQALLGKVNTASPTLGSLAQPFGLAPLLGKLLAVISDVRLSGRMDIATVVENLLRISGEDAVTIPRKYLPDITTTLSTRVMLVSNEVPWFTDGSAAIASRFLILETTRSFFDQEDVHLTAALIEELPGVFLWALDGLDRLRERGRFVQPAGGVEVRDQMGLLASPVRAFFDSCVDQGDPAAETVVGDLYAAWKRWSETNGYKHAGSAQTFGRDLRAAFPRVRVVQHRVPGGSTVRCYAGVRLRDAQLPNA
ncbi:MAG: phage/plasmid primase, P4 family [Burkholderiales bacterium]